MDPPSDLPPPPTLAPPPPPLVDPTISVSANPTSAPLPFQNQTHPSYAEMITAAISAMNEPDGSSRRAIAKYLETHYSNLPPTHSALLTHTLKRLKLNGNLLMVKHSYKLPGSAPPPPALNGPISSDPAPPTSASGTPKRRPGRPPKPKPDAIQAPLPVFAPAPPTPVDMNAVPDAAGPVNGSSTSPAPAVPVRGRGRPPKLQGGSKRGRPRKYVGLPVAAGGIRRGRGRPKKNATVSTLAGRETTSGQARPRGRPRKSVNLSPGAPLVGGIVAPPAAAASPVVGDGIVPVTGKRRGRPPKTGDDAKKPKIFSTGQSNKPRKLSGKPVGRPRKTAAHSQDSQLLVAYLDQKAKLENLQSRVKQTATLIKPYLTNEAAVHALEELEVVAINVIPPSNAQRPQPQPQAQSHLHLHPNPHSQPPPPPTYS